MRVATVVMPEVPKIVYERLRSAGAPDGAHPESNLLAAFAEQALSAAEHESLVQHLAQCAECREMVALSLPALEVAPERATEAAAPVERVSIPRRQTWFAWNRLGWAGLAAGVVIAASVLMMQSGGRKNVNEAQQKPVVTQAPQVGRTDAASRPPSSEVATTAENRPRSLALPAASRRNEMKKLTAPAAAPKEPASPPQVSAQSTGANLGHSLDRDIQGGQAGGALAPGSASETVEVTAAAPVNTESAQTADTLAGANAAAPVVRAKAARAQEASTADVKQQYEVSALQNLPVNGRNMVELQKVAPGAVQVLPQWALHGDEVQRSLDSGARWITVFQHRALLCVAALATDVWAGGKNGDLFHSADAGATWTQVRPSLAGQTLGGDVSHIEVDSPNQVVLSTSTNESWSTTDGGKTWTKK